MCGSMTNIEFAHYRIGSGAGAGQKPDDWRGTGLCGGLDGCHARQHNVGERSFWQGKDVEGLIAAFIKASPKRREIEQIMRERNDG